MQLSWDTRVFGLAEHLKKEAIPRSVMDHFAKEVETEGWQRCVTPLSLLSLSVLRELTFQQFLGSSWYSHISFAARSSLPSSTRRKDERVSQSRLLLKLTCGI